MTKNFCHAACFAFWSLRGCEGEGLSESIKIFDENVAVAN